MSIMSIIQLLENYDDIAHCIARLLKYRNELFMTCKALWYIVPERTIVKCQWEPLSSLFEPRRMMFFQHTLSFHELPRTVKFRSTAKLSIDITNGFAKIYKHYRRKNANGTMESYKLQLHWGYAHEICGMKFSGELTKFDRFGRPSMPKKATIKIKCYRLDIRYYNVFQLEEPHDNLNGHMSNVWTLRERTTSPRFELKYKHNERRTLVASCEKYNLKSFRVLDFKQRKDKIDSSTMLNCFVSEGFTTLDESTIAYMPVENSKFNRYLSMKSTSGGSEKNEKLQRTKQKKPSLKRKRNTVC
jgi:hypothetical protein